jgi:hypothetical protein
MEEQVVPSDYSNLHVDGVLIVPRDKITHCNEIVHYFVSDDPSLLTTTFANDPSTISRATMRTNQHSYE